MTPAFDPHDGKLPAIPPALPAQERAEVAVIRLVAFIQSARSVIEINARFRRERPLRFHRTQLTRLVRHPLRDVLEGGRKAGEFSENSRVMDGGNFLFR